MLIFQQKWMFHCRMIQQEHFQVIVWKCNKSVKVCNMMHLWYTLKEKHYMHTDGQQEYTENTYIYNSRFLKKCQLQCINRCYTQLLFIIIWYKSSHSAGIHQRQDGRHLVQIYHTCFWKIPYYARNLFRWHM